MSDLISRDDAMAVARDIANAMKKKGMVGQSNGAWKVEAAIAALEPSPTPADVLDHALRLPEVARLVEAAKYLRLAAAGYVSWASAERKHDDALAAIASLKGGA